MYRFWISRVTAAVILAGTFGTMAAESKVAPPEKTTAVAEADFDFAKVVVGNDPIEPFNRGLHGIEHFFLRWIFRPIGYAYGSIVPRPVIKCFNNFTDNVGFPVPMFSSFFQAKFKDGGVVFVRFLANTTMSAGFFDPAGYWFGLPRVDEDFGQTFGWWGIGRGCYIGVPSMAGNNVRDTVGMVFNAAFDPKTYFYGGQYFTFVNSTMTQYDAYDQASTSNWDDYQLFKDLGALSREIKLRDWDRPQVLMAAEKELKGKVVMPPVLARRQFEPAMTARLVPMSDYGSQGSETDTLRVAMFQVQARNSSVWPRLSLWNHSDLVRRAKDGEIAILPDRPKLMFRYLPVLDEPEAPLAIIIPGLGGGSKDTMGSALAEMLSKNGYSALILPNPFSWNFMEAASSAPVPGYPEFDSADLRRALVKVLEQLKEDYRIRPNRLVMLGYSMGGIQTLFTADQEKRENTLNIDRFVAINPPVDLVNGMIKLDEFYQTWKIWGREKAFDRGLMAAAKYLGMLNRPHPWQGYNPVEQLRNPYLVPVEREESRMLIGYSFKRTLMEIMGVMQKYQPMSMVKQPYSWGSRQELYDELNVFTFQSYTEKILLPGYNARLKRQNTLSQLSEAASLYAIGPTLKSDDNIRIIHSTDDFLENDRERQWLLETMGERIVFLEYGGHLGNMYTKTLHDHLLAMLRAPDKRRPVYDLPYRSAPAKL